MVITLASPVAWEHHYGIVWPIFIATLVCTLTIRSAERNRATTCLLLALCASYMLISNYFTSFSQALSVAPINLVQSYIYFGGILLLGCIIRIRVWFDVRIKP